MKITIIIEKTKTGYSAFSEKYPVYSVGKSLEELKNNISEAMILYFDENGKSGSGINLKFVFDLTQFFAFYRVINVKALSERIGMNQSLLAQYIKGIKKPSAHQSKRIIQGVRQLGKELSEVEFK